MKRLAIMVATFVAMPAVAHAFCGFYVSGSNQQMFNDATQVVLMRKGTRTVLSMQNNYKGPPSAFAMVIPVPTVLQEGDVKTLPLDVFAHVEQMGAPRLVEYWEQDPCMVERDDDADSVLERRRIPMPKKMSSRAAADLGVTVEAQFVVGEYQIEILSAKDSTGLDTWLHQEHYNIPKGAEPLLRPYVEGGSKWFVAKVDPTKVKFVDGRAALSPLRFHYDTDQFTLPIRLGLANSSGTQDLIVNILAPHQRYEAANYPNVTIPTNLDVKDSVKDQFGAFYAALFDRTVEKHPGSVVTEYAWQATTCDPCPGPALNYHDFELLGADVLDHTPADAQPPPLPSRSPPVPRRMGYRGGPGSDFVLTRLHARYGKDLTDDLVFREAPPIVGGREFVIDQLTGKLEEGAQRSTTNNFQGRYAIRHEWTGPIACANPRRHIWGGPNGGIAQAQAAIGVALAPRGGVELASAFVPTTIPEIGLSNGVLDVIPHAASPAVVSAGPTERTQHGCGCQTSDPAGLAAGLALVVLGFCRSGRRRRRLNA